LIKLGTFNQLEVVKKVDAGIYLRSNNIEILMPTKWIPEGIKIGDTLTAFVYRDSDDRLIATTQQPFATVNTFAYLEVKQTNDIGAFLDWGIDKDLLVPFKEQQHRMYADKGYVVYVFVDEETDRIVASSKLKKSIEYETIDLQEGESVNLLIYSETPLGFNAIINNRYSGLIYQNEVFEDLQIGDEIKGYVKTIREDNKIDLRIQKAGYELVDEVKQKILLELKKNNGFLPFHDNSSPEEIKQQFQLSKKSFKKAIGTLYKEKVILISDKGITLN
jgi:predicted RNA-binding protein (virulence factor B family)